LDGHLHAVAEEIVALTKGRTVEDAASQILWLDTGESVGLASVTSDGAENVVLEEHLEGILLKEGDVVGVELVPSVPVVGDSLVTRGILEVSAVTSD